MVKCFFGTSLMKMKRGWMSLLDKLIPTTKIVKNGGVYQIYKRYGCEWELTWECTSEKRAKELEAKMRRVVD